jgi:carbon-monoxide dehydrogenase small subunit
MPGPGSAIPAGGRIAVRLTVNGQAREVDVEPGLLLVDLLRDRLGLKGTHAGCLTGDCGACTVLLDGRSAKACTVLAASARDACVTTLEGLGGPERLHPVQQAFWDEHGFQCGFCLPGMVLAAVELLEDDRDPTEAEVRHALSGTLCRCTGYQSQIAAVLAAARRLRA